MAMASSSSLHGLASPQVRSFHIGVSSMNLTGGKEDFKTASKPGDNKFYGKRLRAEMIALLENVTFVASRSSISFGLRGGRRRISTSKESSGHFTTAMIVLSCMIVTNSE